MKQRFKDTVLHKVKILSKKWKNYDYNANPPSNKLQKVTNITSILGVVISLILAIITLNLTIKYGESEQKIENLDKVVDELKIVSKGNQENIIYLSKIMKALNENNNKLNDQLNQLIQQVELSKKQSKTLNSQLKSLERQRKVTEINSKPLLKDVSISIDKVDKENRYRFTILIKNYGLRPAHELKVRWVFCKKNHNGEIISHGTQTTQIDKEYQSTLNPNEEWPFQIEGNLAKGIDDLKTLLTKVEIEYTDKLVNERVLTEYYYGFETEKSDNLEVTTLNLQEKEIVDIYLKNN